MFWIGFICLTLMTGTLAEYWDDTCAPGRNVIVHLFNWKWTEIAKECERFLGPRKYCGVQISPPNEHVEWLFDSRPRPWWERYQPVSYILHSRSGTEAELRDMINRCNNVNVRIYVDAVINHMCYATLSLGYGSAGSEYIGFLMRFPAVPYTVEDFNCCYCQNCSTSDCNIQNYQDPIQVRNCRLGSLLDLKLSDPTIRAKIAYYMNRLIDMGVGGFRIDALKHMWPGDVEEIYKILHYLNTTWFAPGTKPFFFNEVIDLGGEAISGSDYTHLGRVTEFRYSSNIGKAFRRIIPLKDVHNFGPNWNWLASDRALVFVDNHDNQRGHGAGGGEVLTFWETRWYRMAVAYTLAQDYGFKRIMSSYYWEDGRWEGDWIGPPSSGSPSWIIDDITLGADGTCRGGWICEHRWKQIVNMVEFSNVVHNEPVSRTVRWDNGANQIAIYRGDKGFLAINNDISQSMNLDMQTGLSAGTYCDVISGNLDSSGLFCTGKEIYVNTFGFARIVIDVNDEDPMIAIHAGSKLNNFTNPIPTPPPVSGTTVGPPLGYSRTIVFVRRQTTDGQDAFVRGGINHNFRPGCTDNAETSPCAISISTRDLGRGAHYEKYNEWRFNNTKLNWYGAQINQGYYYGQPPHGSAMVWTTNDRSHPGYHPYNTFGPHYWLLDMYMDCSQTAGGWFEFKTFLTSYPGGWEGDVNQQPCSGSVGGIKPYESGNHFARCGHVNDFEFGSGMCRINSF